MKDNIIRVTEYCDDLEIVYRQGESTVTWNLGYLPSDYKGIDNTDWEQFFLVHECEGYSEC